MSTDLSEPFLSIGDLAALCGVTVHTVYWWRKTGRGPRGMRIGRHVRFRPDDVRAWLRERQDGG